MELLNELNFCVVLVNDIIRWKESRISNYAITLLADNLNLMANSEDVTAWRYTIERLDIVIITVSGAGIYACLQTMKYQIDSFCECCRELLPIKVAGLFFSLALLANLLSYLVAYYQHSNPKLERNQETRDNVIDVCNYMSVISIILGVVTLFYAFWTIF